MSEMPATDRMRLAITLLTWWAEENQQSAATSIAAVLQDPEGPGYGNVIAGQLDLGMYLATLLARARGAVGYDQERLVAGQLLRELYENLPG
jgi:hypothetical protein